MRNDPGRWFQCIWVMPTNDILNLAAIPFTEKWLIHFDWKDVLDIWAWYSYLLPMIARNSNCASLCAVDWIYGTNSKIVVKNTIEEVRVMLDTQLTSLRLAKNKKRKLSEKIDRINNLKQRIIDLQRWESDRQNIMRLLSTDCIRDDSKDIIFITSLLYWSRDLVTLLSEMHRILRKNWEAIIVDPINRQYDYLFESVWVYPFNENDWNVCYRMWKEELWWIVDSI